MTKTPLAAIILILFLTSVPVNAQPPGDPPRERLGVRVSAVGTTGELNEHFGNGYDFTLYFTERLLRPLYLEVQIGATYMGDLLKPEIIEDLPLPPGIQSEMRFAYLTLGPQYNRPFSETHTFYGSLGLGIYTVTMLFDTGVQAFDESDQVFGVNGGIGVLWRITDNWNLDATTKVTKMWTDDDDIYHIFTDGHKNPWTLGVGFGVAMDLR
jgi:opacity protein-like surface antigen